VARPKDFRDLIVWQKAMLLGREVFLLCRKLPKGEAFGLVTQMRRAAVSVPSNIAEGHGRLSDSQFRRFLGSARGSLYELQTQLELADDLGFLAPGSRKELIELLNEVSRLINGLIAVLGDAEKAGSGNASPASSADSAKSASEGNSR
jgi:four helix bundle protein